jgi:putative transposase
MCSDVTCSVGFKFTLIPTEEQERYFRQAAGTARWAYNFALDLKRKYYEEKGQYLPDLPIRKEITRLKNKDPKFQWLNLVSNNIPKQAVKDCERAFKKFL